MFFILLLSAFILVFFLKLFSIFLSESEINSRESKSSYECGFEHNSLSRVPFSIRYFLITLLFLLFDLEIILLLFSPYILITFNPYLVLVVVSFIIVFLYLRLIYEWNDGSLEWLH